MASILTHDAFNITIFLTVVFIGYAIAVLRVYRLGRRDPSWPPGPPTIPILGNIHQLPSKDSHLQLQKWAKIYGPVYSLVLGTKPTIVLSSDLAIKELLDKKGNIYSDRPDMFISQRVASGGHRLVMMRYGDKWRTIHKLIHNLLNINVAAKYVPYQDLESKFLLADLLSPTEALFDQCRRLSYSLSTQIIFGFRCPDFTDPALGELFYTVEKWGKLSQSGAAQITDMYPILQYLPQFLLPIVRRAKAVQRVGRKLYTGYWLNAKRSLANGTSLPCICNDLLLMQQKENLSDEAIGYIVGSLLEGGSDTTASTLYAFFQAMMVFEEVQQKAQDEIERVVGPDRLPKMEDYANLPYIRSCIKETLRWMPTVILGVPHRAMKDDIYNGWTIPRGATVINNVWAIHMDPMRSPDPRRFNPDRYAGDNTTLYQSANGEPLKRDNFNFGAGRRLCQGIHVAERSLFLCMSRVLWGFKMQKPLNRDGKPITPNIDDLAGGITVHPSPYKIQIVPRSAQKAEIIRRHVQESENMLHKTTGQWKKVPDGMTFGLWKPDTEIDY